MKWGNSTLVKAPRLMSTYKLSLRRPWNPSLMWKKSNWPKGYHATDHKNWWTFCEKNRNCIIVSMQNSCEIFHPHLWLSSCTWKPDEWNKWFSMSKRKRTIRPNDSSKQVPQQKHGLASSSGNGSQLWQGGHCCYHESI